MDPEEVNRRQHLLRQAMAREGIDALVAVSRAQVGERGYVRYVSGYQLPTRLGYAVQPGRGEPVLVVSTRPHEFWANKTSWIKDIRFAPRPVVEVGNILASMPMAGRTAGLVGMDTVMPVRDYLHLADQLPDWRFVDATGVFEGVRRNKGSGEIAAARTSSEIADAGYRRFLEVLKPGRSELELAAEVERTIRGLGASETLILACSGRGNHFVGLPTARPLAEGDSITFWVEMAGPDGYWVERGGMASLGRPSEPERRVFLNCLEAMNAAGEMLRDGVRACDVAKLIAEVAGREGYRTGAWSGHGIGTDVMESPSLTADDDTPLREGMLISLHPHILDVEGHHQAHTGDVYVVGRERGEALSKIPHELSEV